MINNNFVYKPYYEWWKNIDKSILLIIMLLFGLGLFFSLVSTSLIASDKLNTNKIFTLFIFYFSLIPFSSTCVWR